MTICIAHYSQAQIGPDNKYLYSSYTGLNADANLFNDISLNSYELLSTNVQFSKNDDLQKVVFVPFRLIESDNLENTNYNFLYNSKLNFAQKSGISTIGLGFTWDNSMPGTKRGERIFKSYNSKASEIKKEINIALSKTLEKNIAKNKNKELSYILSNDMVNYLQSLIAKINVNPKSFNLIDAERGSFLSKELEIERRIRNGEDPNKIRKEEVKDFTFEDYLYYKSLVATYDASTKSKLDNELTNEYYKELLKNSVKITFGGNYSLFNILGSDDVDLDNDNLNDNEFSVKQKNVSLGFTHIVDECWGYSITGYFLEKRASAEAKNDLEPYFGLSAAIGIRTFILDKNYKTSKDYLESLFVPSIHTGLAFEYLDCNAGENGNCANGILNTASITPYIEFKINPRNQFRLGIPFSSNKRLDSDKTEIGPFIQWRLQLSGNN